ncbi:DUF4179 domain-containing protein [Thalassobacillus hwangdonensis]|uniref:DUF4179 domain-containing protein n=1 Tax=Thalassobacillus hwangdonensis TaxID=546108 RepID=A0ABW3L264_9BACI
MDKKWMDKQMKNIEVPKDEVFQAISKGMEDGRQQKRQMKRKKAWKLSGALSSTAASLVLVSGFLFAPVSNVLADVPVLGSIYQKVGSSLGNELYVNDAVTELNETSTDNGVDVTITSAYYDGNVMGVTFEAKGKDLTIEHMDKGNRPVGGLNYHLFDGKDQNQWGSGSSGLKKDGDTFIGSIEFYSSEANIPKDFTLPLTFTHMADVNGTWKFDVPVEKIPAETIEVDSQTNGIYDVSVHSITKGKATTLLEYSYTVDNKDDHINLSITDNLGNRLAKSNSTVIDFVETDGKVQKTVRELFKTGLDENVTSLNVSAEVELQDKHGHHTLDDAAPFTVNSPRFDYQITVHDMAAKDGELTLDYTVDNMENSSLRQDILDNFAEFVKLVPKEHFQLDDSGHANYYSEMIEHTIRNTTVENSEQDKYRYTSTFDLAKSKSIEDYMLIVPFPTLSLNDEIVEMDPFTIDLK